MPYTQSQLTGDLPIFDSPGDYSIDPSEVKNLVAKILESFLYKQEDITIVNAAPLVFNSQLKKLYVNVVDGEYVPLTTPLELSATGALLGAKVGIILTHTGSGNIFEDQDSLVWNPDNLVGVTFDDEDNYCELEVISLSPFQVRFSIPGRESIFVDDFGRQGLQSSDSVRFLGESNPYVITQRKHIRLIETQSVILEGTQSGAVVEAEASDGAVTVSLQTADYHKYCWFEFAYKGNGTNPLKLWIPNDTHQFDSSVDESVTVVTSDGQTYKEISINTPGKRYVLAQQTDVSPFVWRVIEKSVPQAAGVTTLPALNDVTVAFPVDNEALTWDAATSQWVNSSGLRIITAADFTAGATGITAKQITFTKPVTKIGSLVAPFTSTGPLTISLTGAQDGNITEMFIQCAADPLNPQPDGIVDIGYVFKANTLQRVYFRREGSLILCYSEDVNDRYDALKSLTAFWDLSANFVSSEVPNSGAGSSALKLRVLSGSGLPTFDGPNLEMDFDGVNDVVEVYGGNVAASGASRTFGFVIKLTAGVSEQWLIADNGCQIRVQSSGVIDAIRSGGALSSASGIISFGVYMFLLVECTTTSTKVYKNNGSGGWTLLLSDGVNSANAAFGTGTKYGIDNSLLIKGSAKAFFAHAGILSDDERRRLGYQLSKRYQIAL